MEPSIELLVQLAYALGVGLLIGLERSLLVSLSSADVGGPPASEDAAESASESGDQKDRSEHAGIRTFSIVSLLGFTAALVGDAYGTVPALAFAVVGMLVLGMYFRASEFGHGITTEVALVATCGLGMLCHGQPQIAGVLALVITVLLASKHFTHSTIARMRRVELTDTLKFLVVILIVLPILPDRPLLDVEYANSISVALGLINEGFVPYKVGLLVVLISGIGYVGYFLTRILGAQRGLALTGVIGGLTSSTAVTAAMANQAKEQPENNFACAIATLAANATMFARVLVVVLILDRPLFQRLVWSVGGMAVTAIAVTAVFWLMAMRDEDAKRGKEEGKKGEVKLKNPFSVGPALKFAAFFVFIKVAIKLSAHYLGDSVVYLVAAVSGLADVDAITLEISSQAHALTMDLKVAAIAITIAVVSNSITKTSIAVTSGGWSFGRLVAIGLGLATVVGLGLAVIV